MIKNLEVVNKDLLNKFNKALKPSELLSIAIKEVENIVDQPCFNNDLYLDMNNWVSFMNGGCAVCLAGSVLFGVYELDNLYDQAKKDYIEEYGESNLYNTNEQIDLDVFNTDQTAHEKLRIIDYLRSLNFNSLLYVYKRLKQCLLEDKHNIKIIRDGIKDNEDKLSDWSENYIFKNELYLNKIQDFDNPIQSIKFYKELVKKLKSLGV